MKDAFIRNGLIDVEKFILRFQKPARYIGGEKNTSQFDYKAPVRIVLVYPDIYEIGLGNSGINILYDILKKISYTAVDLSFLVGPDLAMFMEKNEIPLWGLNSRLPLSNFDLIGINIQHELLYPNILKLLSISKIPVLRKDRASSSSIKKKYPIIIGGGVASINPEPIADFLDFFFIGDGENIIKDIASIIKEYDKAEAYKNIEMLQGIYSPAKQQPFYKDGYLRDIIGERVKRISVKIDNQFYEPIVPNIRGSVDKISVELNRGCLNGCRFCQASFITRPYRIKKFSSVIKEALYKFDKTGFSQISLYSLSAADYPKIDKLTEIALLLFSPLGVSVNLPSLRIDAFSIETGVKLSNRKKMSLTFAPETFSKKIKKMINKDIDNELIYNVIENFLQKGWKRIKFYIMLGLGDFEEETTSLIRALEKIYNLLKIYKKARINFSINKFIPKPFTPLQNIAFKDIENTDFFLRNLKNTYKTTRINISYSNLKESYIEAILARGDRRLGSVLLELLKSGVYLNNWTEYFSFDDWKKAFYKAKLDMDFYKGEHLKYSQPWKNIDVGINNDFFKNEYEKYINKETTENCFIENKCFTCGIKGCSELKKESNSVSDIYFSYDNRDFLERNHVFFNDLKHLLSKELYDNVINNLSSSLKFLELENKEIFIYRVSYSVLGRGAFLGHLDRVYHLENSFKLSMLPFVYTHGFNKHIKVKYSQPLTLGMGSECEFFQIYLYKELKSEDIKKILNNHLPEYLCLNSVQLIDKSDNIFKKMAYCLYEAEMEGIGENFLDKKAYNKIIITKKGKLSLKEIIDNIVRVYKLNREKIIKILDKNRIELVFPISGIKVSDILITFGKDFIITKKYLLDKKLKKINI